MLHARCLLALCLSMSAGCDNDETTTDAGSDVDAGAGGAMAVFEIPATGAVPYRAAPFPNDLYTGDDGTIDLGSPPAPGELWRSMTDTINELSGYCRGCAVVFPIDGTLDRATVPADAAGDATPSASDAIVMMPADGGDLIPVEVDYAAMDSMISVAPAGRRTLLPETTYVIAITDAIRGTDGMPLRASPQLEAVRDGGGSGPDIDRAAAAIGPALDTLEAAGVDRGSIVDVAVYTTADTGSHHAQIAAVVDAAPVPVATVDRVFRRSDGTLDALLGMTVDESPGFDNPIAPGSEGTRALPHGFIEMVIFGTFESPRVIGGAGSEIGFVRRGADGNIEAGPQESIPFLLTVPVGADVTSLPVAIAHPGLGGTRTFGLQVGNTLAEIGVAAISIDPFQMGGRAALSMDLRHNARGENDLGPDGLFEHNGGEMLLRVQGISGAEPGLALHTGYLHAAGTQWLSDGMMTIRFAHEGDVSAIAGADAALTGLAFDTTKTSWVGISNGAIVGMGSITGYPGVETAVLSVGAGNAVDTVALGPGFRSTAEMLFGIWGIRGTFDGVTRRASMNPLLSLVGLINERTTAGAALHYLFEAPLYDETPPHVLFQHSGLDETVGDAAGERVMIAAGVPVGGNTEFFFSAPEVGTPPFTNNRVTPNGTVTAASWRFSMADHGAIVVRNGTSSYEPPYRFPFTERGTELTFENPIDEIHAQMSTFIGGFNTAGVATIDTPAP